MRIHPREERCHKAEREMFAAAIKIKESNALTEAEMLRVVIGMASDWIGGVARTSIRVERHGNTDTPGGLE